MKIAVIGAGVVGVATAYELAAQGHAVTVFERRSSVATEGSYALAGLLADCSPLPAAVGGLPLARPRGLDALLAPRLADGRAPATGAGRLVHLPWRLREWRSRRGKASCALQPALTALATSSRTRAAELAAHHQLPYEQQAGVWMLWSRAPKGLLADATAAAAAPWLSVEATRGLQPALAAQWPLKAALQLPNAQVGNARLFTQGLKTQAQRLGAQFCFDTEVRALARRGDGWQLAFGAAAAASRAPDTPSVVDAVVVCAGVGSRTLLRTAQLKLPLALTTGFALTAPLRHLEGLGMPGPAGAVIDAQTGLVISRLGQRVRVSGLQALGAAPEQPSEAASRRLHAALEAAFPGCAVIREARVWQGQRLSTPDGAPLVGATSLPGLWLNIGHNAHDWALVPGAAQLLALQMTTASPQPALQPFAPGRLR